MAARRAVALLGVAALARAAFYPADGPVATLDPYNFDAFVEAVPLTIVEFYAPWCGHCKKLEPQWKTANRLLDEAREDDAELGAQLAVVDAIAEKALADRFGVRGYPAIKWFSRGKVRDYKGARTARAIARSRRGKRNASGEVGKSNETHPSEQA